MRFVVAALAYLAALAVVAPLVFLAVLVLAGPHADLVPSWLQPPIVVTGWAVILVVPALISRGVWRRSRRTGR